MRNINNCGCQPTPCQETPCGCEVFISSDCVNNFTADLPCADIPKGQTLTETIVALDAYICTALANVTNYFTLLNVGGEAEVYKGVNNLGQKEFRTIQSLTDLISINQNTNTIDVDVDETELITFIQDNQTTYESANVGTGATIFKDKTSSGNVNTFNFKSITSNDSSVTITQNTNSIDLSVEMPATNTVIEEGDDINITGTGTALDPYIINSTKEVYLQSGDTTIISGTGTLIDPFKVEVKNLQKTINVTTSYTITDADFGYTIFVNNGSNDVEIVVPIGLRSNFICQFYQEGTGEVLFVDDGTTTINNPIGYKIKDQFYWVALEKKIATNTFGLIGSTKL